MGLLEGPGERPGQTLETPASGEGRRDHPDTGVAFTVLRDLQAGQHSGPHQRGLAAARCAEDQDEALGVVLPAPVEDAPDPYDLVVAAEEDGGIGLLERLEPRVGPLRAWEVVLQSFFFQPTPEPLQSFLFAQTGEADELGVLEEVWNPQHGIPTLDVLYLTPVDDVRRGQQEYGLAALPRHHGLGHAPGGAEPVGRAQHHQGSALAQLLPKLLLPLGAGVYAVIGVRVEEQALVAVAAQGLADLLRPTPCPCCCG